MLTDQIKKLVPLGENIILEGKDYTFEIYVIDRVLTLNTQTYYCVEISSSEENYSFGTYDIPDMIILIAKFGGYRGFCGF